jgi:hypothetical protein
MGRLTFLATQAKCRHKPERFVTEVDSLIGVIDGLRFSVEVTSRNSCELISGFDQAQGEAIAGLPGWRIEAESNWPRLDKKFRWDAKPDIVAYSAHQSQPKSYNYRGRERE